MSFLSDNLLTCRPPYDEPKLVHDDLFCDDFNSILVRNGDLCLVNLTLLSSQLSVFRVLNLVATNTPPGEPVADLQKKLTRRADFSTHPIALVCTGDDVVGGLIFRHATERNARAKRRMCSVLYGCANSSILKPFKQTFSVYKPF